MKTNNNKLTAEEKSAILLTYVELKDNEVFEIKENLKNLKSWQVLFDICQRNKVAPMVYYNLEKIGGLPGCPAGVLSQFVAEKEKIRQQNTDRNNEAVKFLKLFIDNDIPVALIKGVAYGEIIYGNPCYKRMNDIDILIHKKDIQKIYDIYRSLDYFYIGERIRGSQEKSDKVNFVAPAYVSRDFKCVIGTQWGIKTSLSSYKINYEGIWSRMRDVNFNGLTLKVMSPEDNLHHLCLHLGYFKIALRDMMDIYNIVRHDRKEFDWGLFDKIVKETGSLNVVYHALKIANKLCPMEEMERYYTSIEPGVSSAYISNTNKKIADVSLLLTIFSDHVQTIEKNISEFNTTDKFSEKWKAYRKMWKNILFAPREELIKMSLIKNVTTFRLIKARIVLPYRILWAIASEVGWLVVMLLIIKTFTDLVISFVKAPFVSKKQLVDTQVYATKLGVSIDDLKMLNDHFQ